MLYLHHILSTANEVNVECNDSIITLEPFNRDRIYPTTYKRQLITIAQTLLRTAYYEQTVIIFDINLMVTLATLWLF